MKARLLVTALGLAASAGGVAACGNGASSGPVDAGSADVLANDGAGDVSEGGGGDTSAPAEAGTEGGNGEEAGPPDAACTLTPSSSPPCNTIDPAGPIVASSCAPGSPPPAQGGDVADGTYVLQSATWFGSCQAVEMVQETLVVCAGVWGEGEALIADAATTLVHVNYMSAIEDASVVLNPTCTTGSPLPGEAYGYSASGNTLTILTSFGGTTVLARSFNRP